VIRLYVAENSDLEKRSRRCKTPWERRRLDSASLERLHCAPAALAANHFRIDLMDAMILLGYPKEIKKLSVRLAFFGANLALGIGMASRVSTKDVPGKVEFMIIKDLQRMCFRLISKIT
jgi:hypothetical protein